MTRVLRMTTDKKSVKICPIRVICVHTNEEHGSAGGRTGDTD